MGKEEDLQKGEGRGTSWEGVGFGLLLVRLRQRRTRRHRFQQVIPLPQRASHMPHGEGEEDMYSGYHLCFFK